MNAGNGMSQEVKIWQETTAATELTDDITVREGCKRSTEDNTFEDYDAPMETLEQTNEKVRKAVKAVDDERKHCTLMIYCCG